MPTSEPKPHKEYSELVQILIDRGMVINVSDRDYVERKLEQVGYYRLSGFWFNSRFTQEQNQENYFIDKFLPNTYFDEIYKLYLFDKKLRLLLLDIIERLEINIRSVVAHELGRSNPLAYSDEELINPRYKENYKNKWLPKVEDSIQKSKSEHIKWNRDNYKGIPFWVVIEIWDFGTLSKFYSFLKGHYQNKIAKKFNVNANIFGKWLHEINLLRNDCAHHSRVWNKKFNAINIQLSDQQLYINGIENKILGRILVLWYLIKQTKSRNYKWLDKFQALVQEFPDVPNSRLDAMGFPKLDNKEETLLYAVNYIKQMQILIDKT